SVAQARAALGLFRQDFAQDYRIAEITGWGVGVRLGFWGVGVRLGVWVSDLVFGFRLDPRHDLLEFIGQLGTGSQASVHAAGQVGDIVGMRQAKPGGEL